jgi:hypothetical protein
VPKTDTEDLLGAKEILEKNIQSLVKAFAKDTGFSVHSIQVLPNRAKSGAYRVPDIQITIEGSHHVANS